MEITENFLRNALQALKEEIMSHGASVEVLEPNELKTLIRTELEAALKNYQ